MAKEKVLHKHPTSGEERPVETKEDRIARITVEAINKMTINWAKLRDFINDHGTEREKQLLGGKPVFLGYEELKELWARAKNEQYIDATFPPHVFVKDPETY